ncbi:unnamed protein product [Euphydryas editha]|uniref:Uncharacterized protein n=1 Tax=Euphydryas editha TaxID=104508 RepID=A0AAU9V6W7_EUPED|nr:unnamed protein product [Euphydryas editha]
MSSSYIINVPKLKGRENYDDWAFAAVEIPELPSKRLRKPVERYGVSNLSITNNQKSWDGEITYEEAIKGPDRKMWEQAMEHELKAFEENQAWELVDEKEADRVVQCKWVFKKKLESDNKYLCTSPSDPSSSSDDSNYL